VLRHVDLAEIGIRGVDRAGPGVARRFARGTDLIRSAVLPNLELAAAAIFMS
jgi:hypothetical protein